MTAHQFFVDFALASILILAGQFIRTKIVFFQKYFIPSSVIAGFLGLALGPNGFALLPFSSIGSYAGILIILIFTIVGVNGFEFKKGSGKHEAKRIVGYQIYRLVSLFMQFALPILLMVLVFKKLWPDLNEGFGMLMAAGFYGGHGTAAAVGDTFATLGWPDAMDLAITFATIGILLGVFGGIVLINLAVKKNQTAYITSFDKIPGDLRTGLISKENRRPIGDETISPVSLDTLCFHLSIILGISGVSYLINVWIGNNLLAGVPDFTIAYIIALIFFLVFRNTNIYDYIDTGINDKISGTATDYLVFFGIASIRLEVVAAYAGPLALMSLVGAVIVFLMVYPFGKAYNKDSWFERSIFVYGYSTGVFAIGFVLLRIVDPDNKSRTVEDVALSPLTSFIEIAIWSTLPALLMAGQSLPIAGVMFAALAVCAVATVVTKTWLLKVPDSERIRLGVDDVKEAN